MASTCGRFLAGNIFSLMLALCMERRVIDSLFGSHVMTVNGGIVFASFSSHNWHCYGGSTWKARHKDLQSGVPHFSAQNLPEMGFSMFQHVCWKESWIKEAMDLFFWFSVSVKEAGRWVILYISYRQISISPTPFSHTNTTREKYFIEICTRK